MNIAELIGRSARNGVFLYVNDGELHYKLARDDFPVEIKQEIINYKKEIINYLREKSHQVHSKITRRERIGNEFPLSYAQQRLWLIDRFQSGSAEYNMPAALRIEGEFDITVAERALLRILSRHEVLRTVFVENESEPRQIVRNVEEFDIPVTDLSWLCGDEQIKQVQVIRESDKVTPFDLTKDVLLRAKYILLSENEGVLCFNVHHIAADAWSLGILINEFALQYQSVADGSPDPLSPLEIQYIDYALWQRDSYTENKMEQQLEYWKVKLQGAPFLHGLPLDRSRPEKSSYKGLVYDFEVPAELSRQLILFASERNTTLYTLLHAAYALVISCHSGSDDVLVGAPVANRLHHEIEPLIGFFVNVLVLRTSTAHTDFSSFLDHVISVNREAQSNQEVPFDHLVNSLKVPRSAQHMPLVQILLSFNNVEAPDVAMSKVRVTPLRDPEQMAIYDLNLRINFSGEKLAFSWLYSSELFKPGRIKLLNDHLISILRVICKSPAEPIGKLFALAAPDGKANTGNADETDFSYPGELTIHGLFELAAQRHALKTALRYETHGLSYEELNQLSNKLARYLVNLGVKPGSFIGLCVERSLDSIIGILAILKTGCAYVPMDPMYPNARLQFIVEDAGLEIILGHTSSIDKLSLPAHVRTLALDSDEVISGLEALSSANIEDRILTSKGLAYVIYTSGSTGQPKGVLQTHENVVRLLHVSKGYFDFSSNDVWTLFHSISFDFSVWEIWGALFNGGMLVIPSHECARDTGQFVELCRQFGVTVLNQTPGAFYALSRVVLQQNIEWTQLRYVIFGGEALKTENLAPWWSVYGEGKPKFINMYGITETTVHVSFKEIRQSDIGRSIIGRPLRDQVIYLLDRYMNPVPRGTVGEIYIGGARLSTGYLNRESLTESRFIANPFLDESLQAHGLNRIYKTGDLAYLSNEGEYIYKGRNDEQVKIRGFRIELREIEHHIGRLGQVRVAHVGIQPGVSDTNALVAYVVPDSTLDNDKKKAWTNAIRDQLLESLPEYMVPSVIVPLEEMPLTENGKVDQKALAALAEKEHIITDNNPPSTRLQRVIYEIWKEVLIVDHMGIDDNFFHLGGHSLLAIQVINKVQDLLGEIVHLVALFDAPTIRTFSAYLHKNYTSALFSKGLSSEKLTNGTEQIVRGRPIENEIGKIATLVPYIPVNSADLNSKINSKVIFILSPPRSGSTLLRAILAGHSALFAPPELELLAFDTLAQRRNAFSGRNKFWMEGALQAVRNLKEIEAGQAEALMDELAAKGMTIKEFYTWILSLCSPAMLVDKTPSYTYHPDILEHAETLFSNAHYIHLVRHPYGMINSFEKAQMDQILFLKEHDYSSRQLAELVWIASHQNITSFLQKIPESRQSRVSFEQLVRNPDREIQNLCASLDIPFEPSVLNPYDAKEKRMIDGLHKSSRMLGDVKFHTHKGVDSEAAESWKRELKQDFLSDVAWDLAASLGYEREVFHSRETMPPIIRLDSRKSLPLSFAQQRLWFMDRISEDGKLFSNLVQLRVKGKFDPGIAEKAMRRIISRHEALRTVFRSERGGPVQLVLDEFEFKLRVIDISELGGVEKNAKLNEEIEQAKQKTFDLTSDIMVDARYVVLGPSEGVLLINIHHIASDGWSMGIMSREFLLFYESIQTNKPDPLPPLKIQYGDFAHWQRQWLSGSTLEKQLAYWEEQLRGAPAVHGLVPDFPRPKTKNHKGETIGFELSREDAERIAEFSTEHNLTKYMLLHGVLALVLSRHSGGQDIIIGMPMANRIHVELEPLIGFFINTLALRVDTGFDGCGDYFRHVRQVNIEAHDNQHVPFDQIVERLNIPRSTEYAPIFQIMFNMVPRVNSATSLSGVEFYGNFDDEIASKYDLQLIVEEHDNGLSLKWVYDEKLFEQARIARLGEHFNRLLFQIINDVNIPLSRMQMISESELRDLKQGYFHFGTPPQCESDIAVSLQNSAESAPDKTALAFGNEKLTFSKLNASVNRLAQYLREEVPLDRDSDGFTRVALVLDRGVDMVIAILASLKAGLVYVPIDPSNPVNRIQAVLEDARVSAIVSQNTSKQKLSTGNRSLVLIDDQQVRDRLANYSARDEEMWSRYDDERPAYIIYTSGSTGKPKGVVNTHGNLRYFFNLFRQQLADLNLSQDDIWLWNASYAFDASVKGLVALGMGMNVVLASEEESRSADSLVDLMVAHRTRVINAPPQLMDYVLTVLSRRSYSANLIVSGDKVGLTLWNKIIDYCEAFGVSAINAYGPTEATVNATYAMIRERERQSIGYPGTSCKIYLCDDSGDLVPKGAVGEIYIGGSGVASGYFNRPDLNQRVFVDDRFEAGGILFKSGDLARYREDGSIEFLGRSDRQIKLRGYRVELGEIENTLKAEKGIRDAVVLTQQDQEHNERLVAFVTGDGDIQSDDLIRGISRFLPAYMVPSDIHVLESLPVTVGGKIDYRTLMTLADVDTAAHDRTIDGSADPGDRLRVIWLEILKLDKIDPNDDFFNKGGHSLLAMKLLFEIEREFGVSITIKELFDNLTFAAQQNLIVSKTVGSTEDDVFTRLSCLWKEILGRSPIDGRDDFFKLGGHSLLAMKLLFHIEEEFGVRLEIKDLFDHLTLESQARLIEQKLSHEAHTEIGEIPLVSRDSESLPLSFAQQRLWFLDRMQGGSAEYNMINAFRVSGLFDVDVAQAALQHVIERHEILRTIIDDSDGNPCQIIKNNVVFKIERHDLSFMAEQDREVKIFNQIYSDSARTFKLTEDLPLRVSYFNLAGTNGQNQTGVLIFNMHHIASDAWSMNILVDEFVRQYMATKRGDPAPLEPLRIQYADFAHWQRRVLSDERMEAMLSYWRKQLADAPVVHSLPLDFSREETKFYDGEVVSGKVSSEVASRLKGLTKQLNVTPFMLLHGILVLVLSRLSNSTDIVIGTPIANRPHRELEPLIGFFLNMLVLRVRVENCRFSEFMAVVRQTHVDAQANQDIPFEHLVEKLEVTRSTSHTPLFQIMFTVNSHNRANIDIPGVEFKPIGGGRPAAKYDLSISAEFNEQGLEFTWLYDKRLFSGESVTTIHHHMKCLLEQLSATPDMEIKDLFNPAPLSSDWLHEDSYSPAADTGNYAIHKLFESQVEQRSDATAVMFEGKSYSYFQLNQHANLLAHALAESGVREGGIVGLCVDRSYEMIVALLAILKAGATYVPLDPAYPRDRLNYMIEDSGLTHLVVQAVTMRQLGGTRNVETIYLERGTLDEFASRYPVSNPVNRVAGDDLAYVIYTSGSTGRPKGVMISHGALANFIHAMGNRLGSDFNENMRVLAITTIAFDIAVLEIFGPLAHGGMFVLAGAEQAGDPEFIDHLVQNHGITVLQATPATWQMLIDSGWRGNSKLLALTGGEAISTRLAGAIQPICRELWNCYGPTEASVWSLVSEIDESMLAAGRITLGGDLDNYHHIVLDKLHNRVPIGGIGELCIGGKSVARGYLNKPELTSERFIAFSAGDSKTTLYRTGDLVRVLPDGKFEFRGRADDQLKIRGFRIEPGEIEQQIMTSGLVSSAVVVAKSRAAGDQYLAAYVVKSKEETLEDDYLKKHLRDQLQQTLPAYMVPSQFTIVRHFPKTPNGKIDKNALSRLDDQDPQQTYVAPSGSIEKILAEIWAELLDVDKDHISATANFFEMGGHSLLIMRLLSAINKSFGVKLAIKPIFLNPTLIEQANLIDDAKVDTDSGFARAVREAGQSIVNLNMSDSQLNVFCFPPGMGSALAYRELADLHSDTATYYGLQPPQIFADRNFACLGELASYYIHLMKLVQPQGGYRLLGYSLGAGIAYETACQLLAQGDEVVYLGVIDAAPISPRPDASTRPWYLPIKEVFDFLKRMNVVSFEYDWSGLSDKQIDNGIALLGAEIRRQDVKIDGLDPALLDNYLYYLCDMERLTGAHENRKANVDISLLVTNERRTSRSELMDWETCSLGHVDVSRVSGNHHNVMFSPYVQEVADLLKHQLTKR